MANLNKNIKVFFVDLDGTLLDTTKDGSHWISDANVEGIKRAHAAGKHVVISTGRFGKGVQQFMERAGITHAVTGNGSQVVDNKGKLYKDDTLTLQQSLLLFDIAKKYKLSVKLDGKAESYGASSFWQKYFSKKFGFYPHEHYNMPMHQKYHKIVMWGKTKAGIRKLGDEIRKQVPNLSVVSSSAGWTLEVTNENSTKGLGNLFIAEHVFNIKDKKALLHIGDTLNDSTAMPHMRLVAMGNATKELKALTPFIGPKCKNGGVAKIIDGNYKKNRKK